MASHDLGYRPCVGIMVLVRRQVRSGGATMRRASQGPGACGRCPGRHRRERGPGDGGAARAQRGDRHSFRSDHRREPALVQLRAAAEPATQGLGRPLSRPEAEVVRRALHGQRRRGGPGAAGPQARVRCLALGRHRRADRPHRSLQARRVRAGAGRVCAPGGAGDVFHPLRLSDLSCSSSAKPLTMHR